MAMAKKFPIINSVERLIKINKTSKYMTATVGIIVYSTFDNTRHRPVDRPCLKPNWHISLLSVLLILLNKIVFFLLQA